MTQLIRKIRDRQWLSLVREQQEFYARNWTPNEIHDWQLNQFNQQWQIIRHEVPYFARLSKDSDLPVQFSSWQEFLDLMPVMNRKTVQNHCKALANDTKTPDFFRTTGGSTAEPIQLPAWKSELQYANKDIWYARSWFDVRPSDKLFLIWGHSHLLGSGLKGWLNGKKRQIKDILLDYCRWSAYDLSEQRLRKAAYVLLKFQPAYIIAYSVALDRFARVNKGLKPKFHKLGMKIAIATAESFPKPDSPQFIAEVLGCPVVMEYGAVETGQIAHQGPDGQYSVFWRHYFLEGYESEYLPGTYEILVTSLYPRCFPLVRYRLGDLISVEANDDHFMQEFESVIGRCNDYVILRNGNVVHSEAFTHAVKEISSIGGFQVIQSADGNITLNYVSAKPIGEGEIAAIRRKFAKIHADLESVNIERVESLERTVAGKTRRIFRR